MTSNCRQSNLRHGGFTLIEVMVGLAIGMLATVIIMQVFSVFESQKRTTTGVADAQTNGGIAIYNIQSELMSAGYSLLPFGQTGVADSPLECTTLTVEGIADLTTPNRLSPVFITDDPTNTSDSITVRYGDSVSGGIFAPITLMGGSSPSNASMSTNLGCRVGEKTLVINGAACSMATASAVQGATDVVLTDTTNAVVGANLTCLGTWNEVTYAVSNDNLVRQSSPLAASSPIVAGIVSLQAQYGISAPGLIPFDALNNPNPSYNHITQWVDATGAWAAPSVINRNRIKAIRIAVVARNAKKEPKNPATNSCDITTTCSSRNSAAPTGLCAWEGSVSSPAPAMDLSAADADWACYRYRVFETIIPLRNVIWSKDTL